jgi:F0F1-type ATP synthase epsilon subunit
MVHFKQRRDGKPYPAVADGDIDWPEQIRILNDKHYTDDSADENERRSRSQQEQGEYRVKESQHDHGEIHAHNEPAVFMEFSSCG